MGGQAVSSLGPPDGEVDLLQQVLGQACLAGYCSPWASDPLGGASATTSTNPVSDLLATLPAINRQPRDPSSNPSRAARAATVRHPSGDLLVRPLCESTPRGDIESCFATGQKIWRGCQHPGIGS
jgi:hypothetical protein